MRTFEVLESNGEEFEFTLWIDKDIKVTFDIEKDESVFEWKYHIYHHHIWKEFSLIQGTFISHRNLEKEMQIKAGKAFYELMSLIKQHPKWRLKVINIFDDSSREIWNKV